MKNVIALVLGIINIVALVVIFSVITDIQTRLVDLEFTVKDLDVKVSNTSLPGVEDSISIINNRLDNQSDMMDVLADAIKKNSDRMDNQSDMMDILADAIRKN